MIALRSNGVYNTADFLMFIGGKSHQLNKKIRRKIKNEQ